MVVIAFANLRLPETRVTRDDFHDYTRVCKSINIDRENLLTYIKVFCFS